MIEFFRPVFTSSFFPGHVVLCAGSTLVHLVPWVLVVALLLVPNFADLIQKSGSFMETALVLIVLQNLIHSRGTRSVSYLSRSSW